MTNFMSKKVAIFGATGLIGRSISQTLIERGDEVIVFTRSPGKAEILIPGAKEYLNWGEDNLSWKDNLNNLDAVIHLAGENVLARRWNENHKNLVKQSRIESTRTIVNALADVENKPEVFVCASAVGFYGTSEKMEFDEYSKAGSDFLAGVTVDWENEAKRVEDLGIRYAGIRTGIVLSKYGGALARMLLPFKLFIGGPLGDGKQWVPWIHIDDVAGIYLHAIDNPNVNGVLNGAAPEHIVMKEFCKVLGKVLNRPSVFNVPKFVLKILFGEGADILIKGTKVIPKRTIMNGYEFKFDNAEAALKNLLKY